MSQRPDASMDLLRTVTEQALDPDYAVVAARPHHPRSRRAGFGVLAAVALLGLLLGSMSRTLLAASPIAGAERDALEDRVRAADARVAALRSDITALRAEVDALRSRQLGPGSSASATLQRLQGAEDAAAANPVSGPGLVLVLDDAPAARGSRTDEGRLLDVDLRRAVDALWQAGAEAIAINGHRVGPRTAIRSAGGAITVGYRSLSQPYRVEAVGDPRTLPGRYAQTAGASWLTGLRDNVGVRVAVETAERLELPADTPRELRAARKG